MKKMKKMALGAAIVASCLIAGSAKAADTVSVQYIDENGKTQTASCEELYTSASEDLSLSGWWVVKKDTTWNHSLKTDVGGLNLIVCDGCTLKINGSSGVAALQCIQELTLNIYGQEESSGKLILQGGKNSPGLGSGEDRNCGTIYINGCRIYSNGAGTAVSTGVGSGGSGKGEIILNGGTLDAGDSNPGVSIGVWKSKGVEINGGTLYAKNGVHSDSGYTDKTEAHTSKDSAPVYCVTVSTGFSDTTGYKVTGLENKFGNTTIYPQNSGYFYFYLPDGTYSFDIGGKNFSATVSGAATTATYNGYRVTLNQQSGSGGTPSVVVKNGSGMPTATMPTRTGYTFGGYYTSTGGSGTQYYTSAGGSARDYDLMAATTLYAQWTANTYKVTFDQQGGTGGSGSVTATYNEAMPKATMPTRTGYTFGGYWTGKGGTGTQYYNANGSSTRNWNLTAATTLYAQWTVNSYTVTFDQQGGAGGTASVIATYDEVYPKVDALPTKTGHTFVGYCDGTGEEAAVIYNSRGVSTNVYETAGDSMLWAKWKANTYTLTLDGGSFTGKVSVTYGTCPSAVRVPVREGYAFGGYVNGDGEMIFGADGKSTLASYETEADQLLTALWLRLQEEIVLKSAKQRWPWNGKYDVTYEVKNLDPEKYYSIAGDFTLDETAGTDIADIPTKNGEGTVMLDASEIFPAETLTDEVTLKLRLVIRKGE